MDMVHATPCPRCCPKEPPYQLETIPMTISRPVLPAGSWYCGNTFPYRQIVSVIYEVIMQARTYDVPKIHAVDVLVKAISRSSSSI